MSKSALTLDKKSSIDFQKLGSKDDKVWSSVSVYSSSAYANKLILSVTDPLCSHCSKSTDKCCPNCYAQFYCSDDCLKKSEHLKVCVNLEAIKIKHDEDRKTQGSGFPKMVLTYPAKKGDLIFTELEYVIILPTLPPGYNDNAAFLEKSVQTVKMVCFGCHNHFFLRDDPCLCNQCGLIKCGSSCKDIYHANNECSVLKQVHHRNFRSYVSATVKQYIGLYLDICVLRILSGFSNGVSIACVARRWNQFLLLTSTRRFKALKKTDVDVYDGINYMKFLQKSVDFLEFSLVYARYNRDIVRQVYKIMVAFWEDAVLPPHENPSRVIIPLKHFMAHSSCSPNVAVFFSVNDCKSKWAFYAVSDITATPNTDIELTFDFTPHQFMPLPLRMMYLGNKGLSCVGTATDTCRLCQDPSEGGTHSGSIRCLKCQQGLYEEYCVVDDCFADSPRFPTRWSTEYLEKVSWKCNVFECADVQPFSIILRTNQQLFEHYRRLSRESIRWDTIVDAAKFIDYFQNSYLHPTNGVLLLAKFDFIMAIQARNLEDVNCNRFGVPVDPHYLAKLTFYSKSVPELPLFCTKWDRDELLLANKRKAYSKDLLDYFEGRDHFLNLKLPYPERLFLKMEYARMNLLVGCYEFLLEKRPTSSSEPDCLSRKFLDLAIEAASYMKECNDVTNLKTFLGTFTLYSWSEKSMAITEVIEKNPGCARTIYTNILRMLHINSRSKFLLQEGMRFSSTTGYRRTNGN